MVQQVLHAGSCLAPLWEATGPTAGNSGGPKVGPGPTYFAHESIEMKWASEYKLSGILNGEDFHGGWKREPAVLRTLSSFTGQSLH